MDDLISRAAALNAIDCWHINFNSMDGAKVQTDCWRTIKELPAVDAVPVVHAYWLDCSEGNDGTVCRKCSACKDMQIHYYTYYPNYCSECGAKMDGERRDDDGADA